jgi:hypothetical protein
MGSLCFGPSGSILISMNPDPSINKKKIRKTLISTIFLLLFYFLSLKTDVSVLTKSNKQNPVTKKAGSGSVCQLYGSSDPYGTKMSRIHNTDCNPSTLFLTYKWHCWQFYENICASVQRRPLGDRLGRGTGS